MKTTKDWDCLQDCTEEQTAFYNETVKLLKEAERRGGNLEKFLKERGDGLYIPKRRETSS